jgi:hypothetical protein
MAFSPPICLTSRVPQALDADYRGTRFKTIPAASNRPAVRELL